MAPNLELGPETTRASVYLGGVGAPSGSERRDPLLAHPWVIEELALGHRSERSEILGLLRNLPQAKSAAEGEVLTLIDTHQLFSLGIGYADAHLLAATMLTTVARLWRRTSDVRW